MLKAGKLTVDGSAKCYENVDKNMLKNLRNFNKRYSKKCFAKWIMFKNY